MFDKKEFVIDCLAEDFNMPTQTIIEKYSLKYEDSISERHVQRVRKWYNENIKETEMKEEDVFDTKEIGPSFHEREIIRVANEGDMSIQSIADKLGYPQTKTIKECLTKYHYLVMENVLDEEFSGVYFIHKTIPPDAPLVVEKVEKIVEDVNLDGNDDFWEVEIDCVSACSKSKQKVVVLMNRKTREKAMKFMNWAKEREWLAYLVGEKLEEAKYKVIDLYLPEQGTSRNLVNNIVAAEYNHQKVIGVIHSHHEMGAGDEDKPSFSGHDANFINGNHDLSLLAGRDRENGGFKIVGIARVKTPCGALMQVKAEVRALKEEPSDEEKALKEEFFTKAMSRGNFGKSGKNQDKKHRYFSDGNTPIAGGNYHFVNRDDLSI